MKNALLLALVLGCSCGVTYAQDCSKYMKKEKNGVISTKDHVLCSIIMEKQLISFLRKDGKNLLEFYSSNVYSANGAVMDAASESMLVDTVRIDLRFVTREELSLRFDAADSEVETASLRGSMLHHYYRELSEEELKLLSTKRIKEYRLFKYTGDQQDKLDARKWKVADTGNAQDIMNAAKCFTQQTN